MGIEQQTVNAILALQIAIGVLAALDGHGHALDASLISFLHIGGITMLYVFAIQLVSKRTLQALKVAVDTISTFLLENEMMVYIVIFDRKAYQISGKLFADIAAYIDDRYVEEHTDSRAEQRRRLEVLPEESCFEAAPAPLLPEAICKSCSSQSLEEALGQSLEPERCHL